MRKPLSDEERTNIVDRYRRGQGLGFIAYALGRSDETVKDVLRAAGVAIRKRGASSSRNWGWTGETP